MENLNLGKCCICETEGKIVRNVITLNKKTPEEKGGWGCVVCGLEPRGAVAVVCDVCIELYAKDETKLKFACLGYPSENRRIEIEKLTETYEHISSKHPESWDWEKALTHFREIRNQYQQLAGEPGVNSYLALRHVFQPLAHRFYAGERSQELFDEMMSVE